MYYIIHSLTIIYNYYCSPKILNRPLCPLLQKLLDETLHHIGEGLVSSTHVCVCVCVCHITTHHIGEGLVSSTHVCVCVCHITTHHIGEGLVSSTHVCVCVCVSYHNPPYWRGTAGAWPQLCTGRGTC